MRKKRVNIKRMYVLVLSNVLIKTTNFHISTFRKFLATLDLRYANIVLSIFVFNATIHA